TLERFARDREKVLEKAYRRVMREDEEFRKSWDERFRELADSRKEEPDTVPVREKFRIDYEARARRQAKELKKLLPVEEARVGDTVLIEAYGKQANVLEIKGRGSRLKVQM